MRERDLRLHLIILPLAALIAVIPLIVNGCSCGHDFDFHILNWFEAARQFAHGNLHPHWAYTPAFNAGEPRFVFYPPISWTIGAVLGFVMPWTWTPIVYTWLALTAAGFGLYYLAKEFAAPNAALLASAFYIVNPYTLFTAYERTAYAELLAAAWIPLLLHAILRSNEKGGVSIPRIAIPLALLWLTNAPAAVMSCYALALLALIRLAQEIYARNREASLRLILNTSLGTFLGLGLAAVYIIPAAWERRYVQVRMAILPEMRIRDNFLFHHTSDPDHDLVLFAASIIALILIGIIIAALLIARPATTSREDAVNDSEAPFMTHSHRNVGGAAARRSFLRSTIISLALLTAAIAFLLTPISAPLWRHLPEMPFLQFPWRLLAILAAVMALAIATALYRVKLRTTPTIILALALTTTLATISYTVFKQPCDDPDTVQARLALFRSNTGTDPTDEYTPIAADNDSLAQSNPAYWLADDPSAKAPASSTPGPGPGPAPTHLALDLQTAQTLILNLRDYPSWRITRNGTLLTVREQRDDGLTAIPLPAGRSSIAITYAHTPDQTIGDILSALSIFLLLLWKTASSLSS